MRFVQISKSEAAFYVMKRREKRYCYNGSSFNPFFAGSSYSKLTSPANLILITAAVSPAAIVVVAHPTAAGPATLSLAAAAGLSSPGRVIGASCTAPRGTEAWAGRT